MVNTPQPADFLSELPPQRIIGTERECNVQLPGGAVTQTYISEEARRAAGYQSAGAMLDNGFKLYTDMQHLEIDTPEMLGPRQAAAGDAAGLIVLQKIVDASGIEHNGVHCHTGTIIKTKEKTSGYHENYLIPRSITENPFLDVVMASFLTSRMFGMSGTIREKFVLSQKVKGIGDPPITHQVERRTEHGCKPMAMIPPADKDTDTIGNPDWARVEVRFADAGFSLTAQYLSFAATSLVLRLIEHPRLVDTKKLANRAFKSPAATARLFNSDLSFNSTAETVDGTQISAVDYQDIALEEARDLATRVRLPADEQAAIDLWQLVNDQMRKSNIPKGEYGKLLTLLDFAPRHRYITKNFASEDIKSTNAFAVEANLTWDRILPIGGGLKFWGNVPSAYVSQAEVKGFVNTPPLTRATARAHLIRDPGIGAKSATWSMVTDQAGRQYKLSDSYSTTREEAA